MNLRNAAIEAMARALLRVPDQYLDQVLDVIRRDALYEATAALDALLDFLTEHVLEDGKVTRLRWTIEQLREGNV